MPDEPRADAPGENDATVMRPHPPDDATVVGSADAATVMASPAADATRVASPGPPAAPPAAGTGGEETVMKPVVAEDPAGARAGHAGGTEGPAPEARAQTAVTSASSRAGRNSQAFTQGGAAVAAPRAIAGAPGPLVQAVVLGIVTGVAAFALTVWWLLRGH